MQFGTVKNQLKQLSQDLTNTQTPTPLKKKVMRENNLFSYMLLIRVFTNIMCASMSARTQRLLYFAFTKAANKSSFMLVLFGLQTRPACEKILSTGADEAGTARIINATF